MPEPDVPPLAPGVVPQPSCDEPQGKRSMTTLSLVLGVPVVGALLLASLLGLTGRFREATYTVTFLQWVALLFLGLALLLSTALTLFDRTAWSRHAALRLPMKGVVVAVTVGVLASLGSIPPSKTFGAIALLAGIATLPFALRESRLLRIPAWTGRRSTPVVDPGVSRRIATGSRRFLLVSLALALACVAVWGTTWLPPLQECLGSIGVSLPDPFDRPPFPPATLTMVFNMALSTLVVVDLKMSALARVAPTREEAERRLAQQRGVGFLTLLAIVVGAAACTAAAVSESLLARRADQVKRSIASWVATFPSASSKGAIDEAAFASANRSAAAAGLPVWLAPAAWRIGPRRAELDAEREVAPEGSLVVAFPIGRTSGLGGSREHLLILAPATIDPFSIEVPDASDVAPGRRCVSIEFSQSEREGQLTWIPMTREFR